MSFMSLEEFLSLPDAFHTPHRPWYESFTGPEWIVRYHIAKKSFETYGDNPPSGPVEMLVNGHGTRMPNLLQDDKYLAIRTLAGIYENDSRFFLLKREGGTSLSERAMWWRDFRVKDR